MPTPGRTTIRAAVESLTTLMSDNLTADPPSADRPFRRIESGGEHARPYATVSLARVRPIGVVDGDRLFEASIEIQIFADVSGSDPVAALSDHVAAVEDYFDQVIDEGVIDGATGFDERQWKFDLGTISAGYRVAVAVATQTFLVHVERTRNREPAP